MFGEPIHGNGLHKDDHKAAAGREELFSYEGRRFARWKDGKGKPRTAPLTIGKDGSDRIPVQAGTYTTKYRDGCAVGVEKASGCWDDTAAKSPLADLERRA